MPVNLPDGPAPALDYELLFLESPDVPWTMASNSPLRTTGLAWTSRRAASVSSRSSPPKGSARHRVGLCDGVRSRTKTRRHSQRAEHARRGYAFRADVPAGSPRAAPAPPCDESPSPVVAPLKEIRESDGHEVLATDDPRRGLKVFLADQASRPLQVVITDLGMPHLDGRAVARAIKRVSANTPVILLTGWGRRLDAEAQPTSDIDHVLGNPPRVRELRAVLARCQ